ncbi:MAG: dienelactone hydrolase [Synechococcus sp. MED850]|jgi:carboxymethylenebutenolidase|nr:dienelactone hydrolase [Synechococcus sp. MED850]
MRIEQQTIGLTVDDSLMRVHVARPVEDGSFPGLLFYSDIYQLGDPMLRLVNRLAGYGFVVAAPEIFHRLEPVGTVIEPDAIGRLRGNDAARRTAIAAYDADADAVLQWLRADPGTDSKRLGAVGFCIGGHLAFRAAFRSDVKAAACLYPTGLQNGRLGRGSADSLQRAQEIQGALLTVFGSEDPHVPAEAREQICSALINLRHETLLFEANHTFMRDDGWRWDPELADQAWGVVMAFLRRELRSVQL